MYLSRVQVDINNRAKVKDLTHLGAYHNWVEQSFPDEIATDNRLRHLWRLDTLAGRQYLLVLSESKPTLAKLEMYGVAGTAAIKSYDRLLDQLQVGQVMRFRLTANPTRTVTKPGERQGRIFPHVTIAQQSKWLADRAEKAGFQLTEPFSLDPDSGIVKGSFAIVNRDRPVLHRKHGRGVRLSRVTFEGQLRITDVATFRKTLTQGLGREKAFGMGLMTVIPEMN